MGKKPRGLIAAAPVRFRMDLLFISHCPPYPPDKGERIRAYHEIVNLSARHRVHLACFAKTEAEAAAAPALENICVSVHIERLRSAPALTKALARFAFGGSLTSAYYGSRRFTRRVAELAAEVRPRVTLVFSSVMGQHAPPGIPIVADLVDVDSEKWRQYAAARWPRFAYEWECRRLRRKETELGLRAAHTILCTESELALYRSFAPEARAMSIENGVDLEYFDPRISLPLPELEACRYAVFVGAMDYYPNADAAGWFARSILPVIRRRVPEMQFYIVGRNPSADVRKLAGIEGVTVTGEVPDVRPYVRGAAVFVAPLRIARGIQNKVLEALAMGRRVVATEEVGRCFGDSLPAGILACHDGREFAEAVVRTVQANAGPTPEEIREGLRSRFSWETNMAKLLQAVENAAG